MSKLEKLKLEVKDIHKYKNNETMRFAICPATEKEMRLTYYGGIQIWHNGKIFREFMQENQAVEYFNAEIENPKQSKIEKELKETKKELKDLWYTIKDSDKLNELIAAL